MEEKDFMSPGTAGQELPSSPQGISAPWDVPEEEKRQQYREAPSGYENAPHRAAPEDIDLSGFKAQTQKQKWPPRVTLIFTVMCVAILAAFFGITKAVRDINGRGRSGWQSEYTVEETKKGMNDRYSIVGARNGDGSVQLLLEQTSGDSEVTAKVTVVFYNSNNEALDIITGNATMHGKGSNAILEVKVPTKARGLRSHEHNHEE